MKADLFIGEAPRRAVETARSVYAAAFGRPPYNEGPEQADDFVSRWRRYAAERDGARLVLVEDAAFGVAVLARPGDWWRDRAAAFDETGRWIGELCLEVVHLAVHPDRQRQGLGRLAHDILIAGTPAPTAILACNPRAVGASHLYRSRGWTTVTDRFPHGGGPGPFSHLMARHI